jgi:hypothetical protein
LITTNLGDPIDGTAVYRQIDKNRQARQFMVQSRDFELRSFYREATKVRRALNVDVQENYRRAVNRFAARYRLDNRFSFAFARQFNRQTLEVARQVPENAEGYIDTAGNLALQGSSEMMATFFDAVDSYLDGAEEKTLASVSGLLEEAALALGFSEETMAVARDQLTGVVESFFDRVDDAVGMVADLVDSGTAVQSVPESEAPVPADLEIEPARVVTTGQLATV